MEKRYQVFVSSTYEDLKDERRQVNQALLELDCLPAAMELFVATDDDQWTLIQEVIDLSDYYIVIVGGRYGSMDENGISYTEREFDYALLKGIPVLAFVHGKPDNIPAGHTDQNDAAKAKLDAFRSKVEKGRTVAYFESSHELGSEVSRALVRLIRRKPGIGWVRGDAVITDDAEREILRLRAELAEAREASKSLQVDRAQLLDRSRLAHGDDVVNFTLHVYSRTYNDNSRVFIHSDVTWNEILIGIGPSLIDEATEQEVEEWLTTCVRFGVMANESTESIQNVKNRAYELFDEQVEQTLVHLRALGLVDSGIRKRAVSDRNKYLRLTDEGQAQLTALLAVPQDDDATEDSPPSDPKSAPEQPQDD